MANAALQLTTTDTEAKKEDCLKGFQKNLKKRIGVAKSEINFLSAVFEYTGYNVLYCFKVSNYYETHD